MRHCKTFRRTASRTVESTNGPDVQSLTWTPPHRPIFCWKKIETEPPADFSKIRNAHLCRHGANYTAGNGSIEGMGVAYPPLWRCRRGSAPLNIFFVEGMGVAYPPLWRCRRGSAPLNIFFVVCWLLDGSTARCRPYTMQDRATCTAVH
jgi:hypothetical protein